MTRFFFALLALIATPFLSNAQDGVVRLNVRPMAAPTPALKYVLLPEVRELSPGNAAQWYIRCFAEQRTFFFSKEEIAARSRYLSMPLNELPLQELEGYGRSATSQADWGARLDTVDWQVLQRVQTEGADLALPELSALRTLGLALQVRLRGEVAAKRFDNAIRTIKTMFTLSRHLGENPTVEAGAIGLAIADSTLNTLEEMLQQNGCPNLYWALTDLPMPIVDLRKGLQGHASMVAVDFRNIVGDAVMTEPQIEKVVSRLSGVIGFKREQAGQSPLNLRSELAARVKDTEKVSAARIRLGAALTDKDLLQNMSGLKASEALATIVHSIKDKDLFQKLPPAQVILLDEKREYEIRRDDAIKLLGLAPWQIDAVKSHQKSTSSSKSLFVDFLPPVARLRKSQARLEQRIAMLRNVEALRLFAGEHGGILPKNLAEAGVPSPLDPMTGQQFELKTDATVAELRGGSIDYRISIRK